MKWTENGIKTATYSEGITLRVWSMSIMGWRWLTTKGGTGDWVEHSGTARTERSAKIAAKKAAKEMDDAQ